MVTAAAAEGWSKRIGLPVKRHQIIGSCYIFGEGKDVDILVEVSDIEEWHHVLSDEGWDMADGYENIDGWFAARKGDLNLLVCEDEEHYCNMLGAAWVCRALYLNGQLTPQDKDTRVLIHRALTGEKMVLQGMTFMNGQTS